MQPNSDVLNNIEYLTGSADILSEVRTVVALKPFSDEVTDFLNDVSSEIMKDKRCKAFPDVITFGFWIRKASVLKLKERFSSKEYRIGKGVVFHIAPSNVPVNFAYSLASGLMCGNANIVRVPSKDFEQVRLITEAFNKALDKQEKMKPYVTCVRYGREKSINDIFSSMADVRVVWGGDNTIEELRKSPLPPRSGEVTFADRYSIAVIDSDKYMASENMEKIAEDFYNDTFLTDQNACTSPRLVVWTGSRKDEAKESFWTSEHDLAEKKYHFQPIQAVNKLTKTFVLAAAKEVKVCNGKDNLIVRVKVDRIDEDLMEYKDNSGFFLEYDCDDITEIFPLCNDKHCQTIAYIGDKEMLLPLLEKGAKGIDRIVPVGKTMDFDLLWDGYDLTGHLTRTIVIK